MRGPFRLRFTSSAHSFSLKLASRAPYFRRVRDERAGTPEISPIFCPAQIYPIVLFPVREPPPPQRPPLPPPPPSFFVPPLRPSLAPFNPYPPGSWPSKTTKKSVRSLSSRHQRSIRPSSPLSTTPHQACGRPTNAPFRPRTGWVNSAPRPPGALRRTERQDGARRRRIEDGSRCYNPRATEKGRFGDATKKPVPNDDPL